jgi:hypothetical protein
MKFPEESALENAYRQGLIGVRMEKFPPLFTTGI